MLDILTASPTPGAYRTRPMTTAEIDAHPDRDRIWATVKGVTDYADGQYDEGHAKAEAEKDDACDDAAKEERDNCRDEIDYAISALLTRSAGMDKAELLAAIEKVGEIL